MSTNDDQSLFADTPSPDPQIDPSKDYLPELVGEGKKYKSPSDLAKAAVFKDAHILRLEAEAAERKAETERLKAELSTRARLEDLVDNIASNQGKSPSNDRQPDLVNPDPSSPAQTPEQLEAQIDALLARREAERAGNTNRAAVKQKLQEKLGPNYANKVRELGRAVNFGPAELDRMAAQNPTAFFKLLGIEDRQPNRQDIFSTPPQSALNPDTGFSPTDGFRDQAYYNKLRKEKGDRHYWSPEVQTQLHKDAVSDPVRFGLTNS